jgi:hypothetical protein
MVAHMMLDPRVARIRAALVNSGRYSFPEAEAKIASSILSVVLAPESAATPAGQAALLTAVATGVRCFGRVLADGVLHVPLIVPLPIPARTVAEAAELLGAHCVNDRPAGRRVLIGHSAEPVAGWGVQAFWSGWVSGVAPSFMQRDTGRGDCVLAGVAAGALAVGQAFLAEQGDPRAGLQVQSLSLWSPDQSPEAAPNPALAEIALPCAFWLIGLGNLGQAYLWSLFMLPYRNPRQVLLYLQDDDPIIPENWGTSLLAERDRYDILKTKLSEEWADRRKFDVRRIDRRLDAQCRRGVHEPAIALAGVDRMAARRMLGLPGFDYVIDCGLGATFETYQSVRVNTFDRNCDPAVHFKGVEDNLDEAAKKILELPAYDELTRSLNDGGCGAATLAGSAVAVPFVSAFAGAIAVTQAIRIASREPPYNSITATTGDLRTLRSALGRQPERLGFATVPPSSYADLVRSEHDLATNCRGDCYA